jgi:hypothetical protein
MVARDSSTITALFDNLKHVGGHPALWYIGLYSLNRLTENPVVMQFCHLALAIVAIYIFLKYSPFTKPQKILFVLGYFTLYEYAAISRCYVLGLLLIFLFCAVFKPGCHKNYIALCGILCLLSQTSIYGLIIATSLALTLIFEHIFDSELRASLREQKWQVTIATLIFALGLVLSLMVIIPDPDSRYAGNWHAYIDSALLKKTLAAVWRAYVPIPKISYHFWNTNILPGTTLPSTLGFLLLSFGFLLFVRKPVILFLFCVGNISILSFIYSKYFGYMRHHGHLFVLFIVCLWLSSHYPTRPLNWAFLNSLNESLMKFKNRFLITVLCIHLVAGIFASIMDCLYPFSESKNAVNFIKNSSMTDMLTAGDKNYVVSSISGYLNNRIYDLRGERFESFSIFDRKALIELSEEEVMERAKDLACREKRDVLLILNYKLTVNSDSIIELKKFDNGIVKDEQYYLYLLKYTDHQTMHKVNGREYPISMNLEAVK